MDTRVTALEKSSSLSVESQSVSQCDVSPRHTLATATPATSSGSPFILPAAAIPASLRNQILAGNDINLINILLCSSGVIDKRIVDCGDISIVLKECNPRLSKSLSLVQFYVAFRVLGDTICEFYQNKRSELDIYLAIISDLAFIYGGSPFYEYHKSFSAKATMYIQRFNVKLNWSSMQTWSVTELISRHFTCHKTNSCSICVSFSHTSNLCPRSAYETSQGKAGQSNSDIGSKVNRVQGLPSEGLQILF